MGEERKKQRKIVIKDKKELIKSLTKGIITSVLDLTLYFYSISRSIARSPFNSYISNKYFLLPAKSKGYISEKGEITKEGFERLKSILPKYYGARKWDGFFYIAVFDIPEILKTKREFLRLALKKAGFGRLQESVWISAVDYSDFLNKIVDYHNLKDAVYLLKCEKVGNFSNRELVEKVWVITKINEDYKSFLSLYSLIKDKKEALEGQFDYLEILSRDPQLPKELLTDGWKGEEANQLYQRLVKMMMIEE